MLNLSRMLLLMAFVVSSLTACNKTAEEQANRFKTMAASCKTDGDCAKDHICREKKCTKGKRTKEEIAALKKAIAEKEKQQGTIGSRIGRSQLSTKTDSNQSQVEKRSTLVPII